jgi:hypothetical protein
MSYLLRRFADACGAPILGIAIGFGLYYGFKYLGTWISFPSFYM